MLLIVALNNEKNKRHPERITKSKPFKANYN